MIDARRHRDVFNPQYYSMPTHVIGNGAMGTHMATGLVRMGVGTRHSPISLYDFDHFELHNLANQNITRRVVGQKKVDGLAKELRRIEPGIILNLYDEEIGTKQTLRFDHFRGVVFLCLDNMIARADIVKYFLTMNPNVRCVIETRMDARVGISHCFDPNNQTHLDCWWLNWNFPNESENAQGCDGEQSIISAVFGTTSLALKQFERFAENGTAWNLPNRVYQEFDTGRVDFETWPVAA